MNTPHPSPRRIAAGFLCTAAACCAPVVILAQPAPQEHPTRAQSIQRQATELSSLVEARGGFDAWWQSLEEFRQDLCPRCEPLMNSNTPLRGPDGFLFHPTGVFGAFCDDTWPQSEFRSSQEYSASPLHVVTNFMHQLRKRGIDLIFVPIPLVEEIYPESLSAGAPAHRFVSPQRTRLLLDLLRQDVEVLDLIPAFRRARDENDEPLYIYGDWHWSGRGNEIAARELSARLGRYDFVRDAKARSDRYSTRDAEVERVGDLVAQLPEEDRNRYPALRYSVTSVVDEDGQYYRDEKGSPLLILGDSNFGIEELNTIGAQFTAHIAKETGLAAETLWSAGGFRRMNSVLARKDASFLDGRRVVVWIGLGSQLSQKNWRAVKLPETSANPGPAQP